MKYWFVAYTYRLNVDTQILFGNSVLSTPNRYFPFAQAAQTILEQNHFNSVTILNWKELDYIEWQASLNFQNQTAECDVSN